MVRDTSTGIGKVVVDRCISLDGFTAGPGDAMDWVFDFVAPIESAFPEMMAATGAMLIGRRYYEVGKRMADGPQPPAYDGGAEFVLTHDPPDPPDPAVTFLTGGIAEAVATALRAAGGENSKSSAPTWPVVPAAGTRGRDPGVCPAGPARRRHSLLLALGPGPDRPGTARQHTVGSRHDPSVPRPPVVPAAERGQPGR